MKQLSIVIPYYKTYELTVKLLNVLIPQLTKEVEVYLVDDGCNEKRLDIYKEINIIHLEKNIGSTGALNRGIEKATGKYIGVIDSDDIIAEDYIKTLLDTIKKRDEDTIFFEWQDLSTGEIIKHPQNPAIWKAIYKKEIMPKFNENVRYSYDVPFQEDLKKIKTTRYDIEKVLYFYNRLREGNLTSIKEKIRRNNMIKVEVVEEFSLKAFGELKNIQRRNPNKKQEGKLYVGDTFECSQEICEYLTGKNSLNKSVVKVIEVIPEKVEALTDGDEIVEATIEYTNEPIELKATIKPNKKKKKK